MAGHGALPRVRRRSSTSYIIEAGQGRSLERGKAKSDFCPRAFPQARNVAIIISAALLILPAVRRIHRSKYLNTPTKEKNAQFLHAHQQ